MKYSVDAVLAPAHFVDSLPNGWTTVDLKLCEELRNELDRSGGKDVALDFQIITTNTLLKDAASRELLISSIRHLPIENVWIRASGFGATAMLASKKRLVSLRDALGDLHATDNSATRSSAPTFRGNFKNLSSAAGGQK